jgi:hypothetical protein
MGNFESNAIPIDWSWSVITVPGAFPLLAIKKVSNNHSKVSAVWSFRRAQPNNKVLP